MTRRSWAAALSSFVLVACAPQPSTQFAESAFAGYSQKGAGRISGVAVDAKAPDATPSEVTLVPATSYTRVVEARVPSNFDPLRGLDARLLKYERRARPDAAGRFSFGSLPAGAYYVIFCATKPSTIDVTQSDGTTLNEATTDYRFLYAKVSVAPGQPVQVSNWHSS